VFKLNKIRLRIYMNKIAREVPKDGCYTLTGEPPPEYPILMPLPYEIPMKKGVRTFQIIDTARGRIKIPKRIKDETGTTTIEFKRRELPSLSAKHRFWCDGYQTS
jgi:hypothetical protein